ncbi:ATP-binding cassette domain-containing protein [Variovorax boronicumulans]|uniref:ATP-binding cassette domain-containing protein n=1 Tax=Variovorax boronicumulans TaxID=436515 RepID=UPI001C587C88
MRTTEDSTKRTGAPALVIEGLDVHYGQAHVLQSVSLALDAGVLAVVGRNGMGKTTLCRAITGMAPATGSIRFRGHELRGLAPDEITRLGVAYVPQGRRVWRSLTVDEHLQLASRTARRGAWTVARVYDAFPRLAERRRNGGAQLSGGEQQMLAIGRALLFNPSLLVMDEPTEGLAPVIVEHVATLLKALADEGSISILLIEQNLGVALEVAERVAVMVNGRVAHTVSSQALAADSALQQRLLGLQAGAAAHGEATEAPVDAAASAALTTAQVVLRVRRAADDDFDVARSAPATQGLPEPVADARPAPPIDRASTLAPAGPAVHLLDLAGAQAELQCVQQQLSKAGRRCVLAPVPMAMAQGQAADTLRAQLRARDDLAGLLVLAGPGDEALARAVVEGLPMALPKFVVGVRGGDPQPTAQAFTARTLPGAFNRVSQAVLSQVAASLAALVAQQAPAATGRPVVCITTADLGDGVARQLVRTLEPAHECLLLRMDAAGERSLPGLIDSGLLAGVIDLAPLDVARTALAPPPARPDAGGDRFTRLARTGLPYLSAGLALDLLHYASEAAMPSALHGRAAGRNGEGEVFLPLDTAEAERVAAHHAAQLNGLVGPVRLLLPAVGGQALRRLGLYQDAAPAQLALHRTLARQFRATPTHRLQETGLAFDDPRFADSLGRAWREIATAPVSTPHDPRQRSRARDALQA